MRKIIALLALIPTIASAEFIPVGCYVADYYRTDPCWYSNSAFYQWTAYDNQNTAVLIYGSPVAAIIQNAANEQTAKNACLNNLDNAIIAYQSESKRADDNYNFAIYYQTEFNKQLSYAKKLKKACGSKCKKIKAPK
jgi:hypothetical protein